MKTIEKKLQIKTKSKPKPTKSTYYFTDPAPSERGRTISRISVAKGSNLNFRGRKSNSLMNLCGKNAPQSTIQNYSFFKQQLVFFFFVLISFFSILQIYDEKHNNKEYHKSPFLPKSLFLWPFDLLLWFFYSDFNFSNFQISHFNHGFLRWMKA